MPGVSAGSASSTVLSASVPPVEAPITTTFSVVFSHGAGGRRRIASAVSLGSTGGSADGRAPAHCAAAFTASHSITRDSSRNCRVPSRGLVMISTAPYSSALSVLCAPSSARLEQITTGIGCWLMIFLQERQPVHARHLDVERDHVRHSARAMRSAATKGSAAVPITSISGSRRENFAQRLAHHRGVVDDQDT